MSDVSRFFGRSNQQKVSSYNTGHDRDHEPKLSCERVEPTSDNGGSSNSGYKLILPYSKMSFQEQQHDRSQYFEDLLRTETMDEFEAGLKNVIYHNDGIVNNCNVSVARNARTVLERLWKMWLTVQQYPDVVIVCKNRPISSGLCTCGTCGIIGKSTAVDQDCDHQDCAPVVKIEDINVYLNWRDRKKMQVSTDGLLLVTPATLISHDVQFYWPRDQLGHVRDVNIDSATAEKSR